MIRFKSLNKLQEKCNVYSSMGDYLNDRQKRIRNFIKEKKAVKVQDIDKQFPDISRNTIKKDLQYLKNEKFIDQMGQNKGTVYVIKK